MRFLAGRTNVESVATWTLCADEAVETAAAESAAVCTAPRKKSSVMVCAVLPNIFTHQDVHDQGSKKANHRKSAIPGMSALFADTDGDGGLDMLCHTGEPEYAYTNGEADVALDFAAPAASNDVFDAAAARQLLAALDAALIALDVRQVCCHTFECTH